MSKANEAEALGYQVVQESEAPKAKDGTDSEGFWASYRVRGLGLDLLVREDDHDVWAGLLDPEAHAERVRQDGETPQETHERLLATERERLVAEGLPLGAMQNDPLAQ